MKNPRGVYLHTDWTYDEWRCIPPAEGEAIDETPDALDGPELDWAIEDFDEREAQSG